MSKTGKKVAKNLLDNLGPAIGEVFFGILEELIQVYLDTYDEELLSVIVEKNSLANPVYFYDDYMEALENFDYVEETTDGLIIRIPSEDTFNFKGRLGFLALLTHDLPGKFLEVTQEDYSNLISNNNLSKGTLNAIRRLPPFFDSDTPKDLRFYLLPTNRGTLHKTIESALDKKLVVFPFSNSSAIDLFGPGIEFFEVNVEEWFEMATDNTNKNLRGV